MEIHVDVTHSIHASDRAKVNHITKFALHYKNCMWAVGQKLVSTSPLWKKWHIKVQANGKRVEGSGHKNNKKDPTQ